MKTGKGLALNYSISVLLEKLITEPTCVSNINKGEIITMELVNSALLVEKGGGMGSLSRERPFLKAFNIIENWSRVQRFEH